MDGPFFLIEDLIMAGGSVMWAIAFSSVVLWFLIIERLIYIQMVYPADRESWLARWNARTIKQSWPAHAIRRLYIARAQRQLSRNMKIIRMLTGLCPMLGLLGTVAGMIQTFDVMAAMGTANARAMASGISAATITTMAGLVIAIPSLYFSKWIKDRVDRETRSLSDMLTFH
jgi:biopolymer transport protein ExbB